MNKDLTVGDPAKVLWKFCLPLCLPLIFHHLSQIILAQCDRIMLQQLLNDNGTVGIYSFIFTFVHILNIIWSALNNTWVPFYYDYVKQNNTEVIERKSKNYMFLYTALCIGFVLLSPEVVKLFSSEDFWSGMELIPIIAFSCYMVFLYSFQCLHIWTRKRLFRQRGLNLCSESGKQKKTIFILNFLNG